jgi:hypothetical protein
LVTSEKKNAAIRATRVKVAELTSPGRASSVAVTA